MADLKTINCTGCGAGLSVLGGGRVRSHTCGYCGAVMDAQENYALLRQYQDMRRPMTPFEIGMTGTIKGVDFTIIGILGHQSRDEWNSVYTWVDHQLFSPTHGYCWLSWNDGHCVFSRRVRVLPDPSDGRSLPPRRTITVRGEAFKVFDRYTASVTFCEGEFTWAPEIGETAHVIEAIKPPQVFSYVKAGGTDAPAETEYELSDYLDQRATLASFGASYARAPDGVHPAQPFWGNHPVLRTISQCGGIMAVVALVLLFAMMGTSTELAQKRFPSTPGPHTISFEVADPSRLHEIELYSPVSNNWAYYDLTLTHDDEDQELANFGREIEYYSGREGGESWSEGSRRASIRFRPPAEGEYTLEFQREEQGDGARPLPTVTVSAGVAPAGWLGSLAVVFLLTFLSVPFLNWRFERKRWGAGDDDDDD